MKKIVLALALFLLLSYAAYSQKTEGKPCIYFFYGTGCPHCAVTEPVINQLENRAEVHRFEVYGNRSNMVLLTEYFNAYGVPENLRGVPVVFAGSRYLVGDEPILEGIEDAIDDPEALKCPSVGSEGANYTGKNELNTIPLFTVIGAALVDSINPCAIAVLLILLGALLASGSRKRAVQTGSAFIASIYIAYFFFGIGLFSALQISGLSFWFYKIVGFLAVLIGLANIKDFFWYGKGGFVMEIPRSWRPSLKSLIEKATSPIGAFIMGFAVCLFELPCTGGPYIFILGLLAEKATMMAAIPLLLLYNIFFVLPLIIITLLMYFELTNIERTSKWKEKNIRLLHLIGGLIMLALGAAVIAGFV